MHFMQYVPYSFPYPGDFDYNLSHNNIKKLPLCDLISGLSALSSGVYKIDLSYNSFVGTIKLNNSSAIKNIDLSNNNIDSVSITDDIDPSSSYKFLISKINLSNNKLKNFPKFATQYQYNNKLDSLNVSNNLITQLPNSFNQYNIYNINISSNNISDLPSIFTTISGQLNCKNTSVKCLPLLGNGMSLLMDTSKIKCIPNCNNNIINGVSCSNYPICTPANNANNCTIYGPLPNYVNIPDTNFGKFLIAKYPSCLYKDANNKYWMDTTCGAVVNEDSLDCSYKNISSIDGIQYFDNLYYLHCNNNSIIKLNLPNSNYIGLLDCSNNLIDTFPKFNLYVGQLNCRNNQIKTFLGGKVEYVFNCSNNLLENLDSISQISYLVDFDCSYNKLKHFPSQLGLSHNINCSNNMLTLPFTINVDDQFNCSYNKLNSLPINTSTNNQTFICSNNLITSLTIPENCKIFICDSNSLNSLVIPTNAILEQLVCQGNDLNCLPKLPNTLHLLRCDTAKIKCIPNFIPNLYVNLTPNYPVCNATNNPNNCTVYNPYVNIPDTNFGKFLIAKYPSCLYKDSAANKYYMDTTCGAVVGETSLDCQSLNIVSLEGIEYFKKLRYLDCSFNYLHTLPKLSDSLITLYTHGNGAFNFSFLPEKLKTLTCGGGNGVGVVSFSNNNVLPNSLDSFSLTGSLTPSLPNLPNKLKFLDCSNNSLSILPTLPDSLKLLDCSSNIILQCLPHLPNALGNLKVTNTLVNCLPNIPLGLNTSLPVCNTTNNPNNCPIYGTTPANYVNIPDTNFGKFLIAKYPSCLYKDANNKYWMDTTCGAVVNEFIGYTLTGNIQNIFGIQFFKKINSLFISNTQIDSLIDLPNSLKYFQSINNPIVFVNKLPDSLIQLTIRYSLLDTLPSLPSKLSVLDVWGNRLTKLPILPLKLADLTCPNNLLSVLPLLPNNISNIKCFSNRLTVLPKLPDSLTSIWCDGNLLTALPTLPENLTDLDCSNNPIECMPKIPNQMKNLTLSKNIKCISNIPNSQIHISPPNIPICNPTNNPNQCHIYPNVSGNVFTDNNSNSTKDTLEFYRPFVKLSLNNGQITYSNLQGGYGISVDTLGSYTLKVTPPPYFKAVPDSVPINFTANTSVVLPDIALQPIATVDSFAIHITKLNRPRPGFKYAYNVSYGNVGTVSSANNNIVNVVYDTSKIHFDSASVAIQSNTYLGGNYAQVVVNAGSVVAGQGGTFNVYYTVKPTVAIGDSIRTSADISYAATKTYDTDSAIVIGSFDPNDKQATPTLTPVQIQNGEYIDYVVRFQNTGNANATNIVIADTLSSLLLYNNIQVVASSHSSNISYRLGNGIIYFEFLNIDLPYATANEPLSHGFVKFRVRALPTLATGVIIPNKAHIYFDYNQPIITNTATTQIKAIVTPVRIMSYTVSLNEKRETRNVWTVGVEINVSHYVVQRSENGRDFTSVGEVAAQGLNNYSFTDKLPTNYASQAVYYRLKIVDKDGKVSYSVIRNLELGIRNGGISITPNPSKGNVNIDVANAKELLIIDYLGKIVKKQILNAQLSTINYQLAKGVYLVKLIMNNGEAKTSKLIIE